MSAKDFFRLAVIVGALPVTLTNGTTADATQVMADLNWLVNQVNANAAPLVGTAMVASNNNFTVVQSGQAATQPSNFPIASQVQNFSFNTLSSNLGTNTITARIAALPLSAYAVGQVFTFVPSQRNTSSVTINIDALGSAVVKANGSILLGGELGSGTAAVRVASIGSMPVLDLINKANDINSNNAAVQGSSLVLLLSASAATSATIDFTTKINSTYDEYLITFTDANPSIDGINWLMRVSLDNGATFEAGATYAYAYNTIVDTPAATPAGSSGAAFMQMTAGVGNNVVRTTSGWIKFSNPAGTAANKKFRWEFTYQDAGSDVNFVSGGGTFAGSQAAVNGIRILPSSGTIVTGRFRLYGMRTS